MTTMKAVRLHEYGGPDVLRYEDAPRPEPKAGELLVRVRAVAVNAIDWKLRAGAMRFMLDLPLPIIPGCDMAGTVAEVGAGVQGFKEGDEVYAMPHQEVGAYAEYIVVQAEDAALKPHAMDFVTAASLPTVALTAWQALFDVGGLQSGQTALIHGAGGGVGSMAVQFARHRGAKVIATASADKIAFVKSLGADAVIDYRAAPFEQAVRDVDFVLDVIAGDTQARSWQTLRANGVLVSTIPPAPVLPPEFAAQGVQGRGVAVAPNPAQLHEIADLIDAGKIKTVVGKTLPLEQAQTAHEMGEQGKVQGKIVLQIA